ncbi:MAG: undecaprenyl-diphosphate phosphatase [Alphaproteobacteria bacterium]
MSELQIIILAFVQGVTEFLPISSSGHLAVLSPLMNWQDQGLGFDISVHVGTLFAVLVFCRAQLWIMIKGCIETIATRSLNAGFMLALMLVIATLPIIFAGFLLKDMVEMLLRNMYIIASTTLIFGILLGIADRKNNPQPVIMEKMGWRQALAIGAMQILALVPGVSRSGITITAALMLGFDRKSSANFSFLLSIPTILGAATLLLVDLYQQNKGASQEAERAIAIQDMIHYMMGAGIAAIIALLSMRLLMAWLSKSGFMPFVIYRIALGLFLLFYAQYFLR